MSCRSSTVIQKHLHMVQMRPLACKASYSTNFKFPPICTAYNGNHFQDIPESSSVGSADRLVSSDLGQSRGIGYHFFY
jgi:hypothetical protein